MADLNFPQNPQVGDTYSIGNRTWVWNGSGWQLQSGIISTNPFIVVSAQVTTTTNSTSTNTGALVVEGGGGFGGDIWANRIYAGGAEVITTSSIGNFGVSAVQAGTDTAVANLIGNVVLIWNTSTLETVTGRGSATTNAIQITNSTDATTTDTGALTVAGGVGIGKQLRVVDNLTVGGTATLNYNQVNYAVVTGATTGSAVALDATGADSTVNLDINAKGNGVTKITSTAASATTANNSLYVAGGLGVKGAAYINGVYDDSRRVLTRVYPAAGTAISITNVSTSNDTTSFTINNEGVTSLNGSAFLGVSAVVGDITLSNLGVQSLTGTQNLGVSASTGTITLTNLGVTATIGTTYLGVSQSTGSVTFTNLGVQTLTAGTDTAVSANTGTITVWSTSTLQSITDRGATTNNAIAITNATGSTGTENGALTVAGGVGVGQNLNVAGSMNVKGPVVFSDYVSFNGTSTYVYSTNTYYTDNILELHVHPNGVDTNWEIGDGKDIGLRFHYFNRTDATGTNAALVLADDTQMLEWYQSGAEDVNGVFTSSAVYGAFKLGTIHLVDATANVQNATSGALQIAGGVGVAKTQWIGGTGGIGASTATLEQSLIVNAGGIGVNGDSYFANNVGIAGNTVIGGNQSLTGNATVGGNLKVTGVSTLTGNVTAGADLSVTGASTLNGNIAANGDLGVAGNFNVTGTSVLTGNVTASGDLEVGAGLRVADVSTFSGVTYFTDTTESAGTGSGAVIISGGVGVLGSVNVGGNMFVQGTINAQIIGVISTASNLAAGAVGAIPYQTGYGQTSFINPGAAGTILTSNGANAVPAYQNTLTLAGTTQATSTQTGAFITLGGAGIGKDLWVGGDIYTLGQQVITTSTVNQWSNQTAVFAGTDTAVSTSTGNITVWNTSTLDSVMFRGGTSQYQLVITNETPSTSTQTGAVLVTGGVGIGGDLNVGGNANVIGSLTVGATVVGGSTSTFDYLTLKGTGTALTVTTNAVVGGNLTATTLNVTGRTTLADVTAVNSTLTSLLVLNDIITGRSVGINQNFNVTGTSVLTGDVYANANVGVNGNLHVTGTSVTIGSTYIDSNLGVKGNVYTTGTSVVIGNSYVDSNLGVKGNFNVTGTTTISGLVSGSSAVLSGSLGVTGTTTLSGSVNIGPVSQHVSFQSPSTSTTATISLDSFAATDYRSAKYFVQVVDSGVTPNKVHVAELVVFHDNNGASTLAYIIQYGIGHNTGELGAWNAVYGGGNITLQFTPNYTPVNLVVKTVRTAITT